jgi:hypothetical protein
LAISPLPRKPSKASPKRMQAGHGVPPLGVAQDINWRDLILCLGEGLLGERPYLGDHGC